MITYSAKIIADSISPDESRLTTMEVTFPRFILAEVNTHRKFSRNSASSRARSLTKTIDEVSNDPFIPDYWGKHQPGMAAHQEINDTDVDGAREVWLSAKDKAVDAARTLEAIGLHKQLVNRLLEPFMWHTALISSTEWDNFFTLRIDPAAQPEIQRTAQVMKEALQHSSPVELQYGEWHLPYVTEKEKDYLDFSNLRKVSVARCARVSYLTQGSDSDVAKDCKLADRLLKSRHLSPFEHVATPEAYKGMTDSNFDGWDQLRKIVE